MTPPVKKAFEEKSKETLTRSARLRDLRVIAPDTFSSSSTSLPKVIRDNGSVAIGESAGQNTQGSASVAIGLSAGRNTQGNNSVAVGLSAGFFTQGNDCIAVGSLAGETTQGGASVAIGSNSGQTTQGNGGIAVGSNAGKDAQGPYAVALGVSAGKTTQGTTAIALGFNAGETRQGGSAVAIGASAGQVIQAINSIAIGLNSGRGTQGMNAVAIGANAGSNEQLTNAVAVGVGAGQQRQGLNSVAIGPSAGRTTQGDYSIAIGSLAGETNQPSKSICLNATGVAVNPQTTGLFIDPIRIETQLNSNTLSYNPNTKEITYSTAQFTNAQQAALDLKAPLENPAFTGTVSGVTKAMVGLGNADNTSDANKPVSNAQQAALGLKAPLESPAFTGTVISTTPETTDSSTRVATTKYVKNVVSEIIGSASETLNTLKELADALGNDPNLSATLTTSISLKAPLNNPTFTGTVSGVTKAMVGLGNADNTSDAEKPVSNAQQAALDLKAPLASPAFTGTAISTTPETTDNSTRVATTKYVKNVVNGLERSFSAYLGDGDVQIPLPTRPYEKLNLISLGHKNIPYFENFNLSKIITQPISVSNITAAAMLQGVSSSNISVKETNLLIADNGRILRYKIGGTIKSYYVDTVEHVASVWLDSNATQPGTINCFLGTFFGGNFTTITQPSVSGIITQHCIGRMDADFKIKRIFQNVVGGDGIYGVNGPVYALAYTYNSSIKKSLLVGGSFTSVMPVNSATTDTANLSNLVEIQMGNFNGNDAPGLQFFFNGGFNNNTLRVTKSATNSASPARVNSIVCKKLPREDLFV